MELPQYPDRPAGRMCIDMRADEIKENYLSGPTYRRKNAKESILK